jgi:DNA-nicking Smr family endonuclease
MSDQTPGSEDVVEIAIRDVFDLHTFAPRDVKSAVEGYLEAAHELGFRYVRIVHGRGIGVQRDIVRRVLAGTTFVLEYADAPPEAGGWGATTVTLDCVTKEGCLKPR